MRYQDSIPPLCGAFPSDVAVSPIKKKKTNKKEN